MGSVPFREEEAFHGERAQCSHLTSGAGVSPPLHSPHGIHLFSERGPSSSWMSSRAFLEGVRSPGFRSVGSRSAFLRRFPPEAGYRQMCPLPPARSPAQVVTCRSSRLPWSSPLRVLPTLDKNVSAAHLGQSQLPTLPLHLLHITLIYQFGLLSRVQKLKQFPPPLNIVTP